MEPKTDSEIFLDFGILPDKVLTKNNDQISFVVFCDQFSENVGGRFGKMRSVALVEIEHRPHGPYRGRDVGDERLDLP